jgi:inorganic triphosphatase YgiF
LARAGISLRVRHAGGTRVQTVKLAGAASGPAVSRGEWEWPVDSDQPDLARLAETPATRHLGREWADRLEPVFVTDIARRVGLVRLDGKTVVEAAFGEGEVRTAGAREAVNELELELKEGAVGSLFRLALDLIAEAPIAIQAETKAEIGMRLRTGALPAVHKAPDLHVKPAMPAAVAVREIIGSTLGHMLANIAAARAGDAEGVHQLRVAVRRMRAATMLLRPCLEPHATARFDTELRRLGRVFGEIRDWDVFVLETLPAAKEHAPDAAWVDLLHDAARAPREAAQVRLKEELDGPLFTRAVLSLAAWIEEGATLPNLLGGADLTRPIGEVMPSLLDRLAAKVAKRGRHIGRASRGELHRLRKSAKKLRYGVEFAEAMYRHKPVKKYLHACKTLQTLLGDVNDATVAVALAEQLSDGRPDLAPAIASLAPWIEHRAEKALGRISERWNDFLAVSPPWR